MKRLFQYICTLFAIMPRPEVFNRTKVIEQARDVFWLKGFNGTSMQDLVDATGLNRSSLYNSFGSKMELYQTALREYQSVSSDLFLKASNAGNDPLDRIRKVFELTLLAIKGDVKSKGCMVLNCATEMGNQDKKISQWLGANQELMVSKFKILVDNAMQKGMIPAKSNSQEVALYLVSAHQGFRLTGMHNRDVNQLKQIIDRIIKSIT